MSADVSVFGRVRQLLQGLDQASVGDEEQITLNEQLEQLVAFGASPYGEIVKIGRAFELHTTTAVAAVVAVPTTAALLGIWNGEPDGGRSLVIDRVWALMAASAATAGQATLIGAAGQTRVATIATPTTLAINALNSNGGKDTKISQSVSGLDAVTGVAGNWRALPGQTGGQHPGAAATPGVYINSEVNGRIIIPPGRQFGVHVFADAVGSTFTVGIEWHERYMRLG
jgi:hypothetical protein